VAEYRLIETYPQVEQSIIDALVLYFHDQVKIQEIFPNFGALRIDETHPAAILNVAEISGKPAPGNIFPSITVNTVEDSLTTPLLNYERNIVEITEQWALEQLTNPMVLKSQAQALYDYIHTATDKVFGVANIDRIHERLLFAIWSENRTVLKTIYAHLRAFVHQSRTLFEDLGLQNISMSGTPAGLYNLDWGKLLYGAELSADVDRQQTYVYVNTAWASIKDVQMSMAEVDYMLKE
jgi:hypothetical protein